MPENFGGTIADNHIIFLLYCFMKKNNLLTILLLFFAGVCANAQDKVTMETQAVKAGDEVTLSIGLENEKSYVAFVLDIVAPEGVSFVQELNEDEEMDYVITNPRKKSSHQLSNNYFTATNTLRVAGFSSTNATYKANSGEFLTVKVKFADTATGKLDVKLTGVVFTDADGIDYPLADVTTTFDLSGTEEPQPVVIHDTIYVDKIVEVHDTAFVDKIIEVHDTAFVDKIVEVHDTAFIDKIVEVHDTAFIDKIVEVHDTTVIVKNDTVYLDKIVEVEVSSLQSVAAPIITVDEQGLVTLTCHQTDAAIYYTIDGSEPSDSSTLYSQSFTVEKGTTIKAIAVLRSQVAVQTATRIKNAQVSTVASARYFSTGGKQVGETSRGMKVVVKTLNDGTLKVKKVVR